MCDGAEYHLKHLQERMCHALAKAAQLMCILLKIHLHGWRQHCLQLQGHKTER